MPSSSQKGFLPVTRILRRHAIWLVLTSLVFAGIARAQAPPATIGRITGDDVSVQGAGGGAAPDDPHSILLASGSEITIHSGRARIDLVAGGDISICGPAKLTLLDSGGPTTVALSFGRIHVHLAGDTPLTVFTPTVVGVPLALSEGPREAIIGLENSGAMCARAVSGGLSLEQQLTGETLVVPQPREVFFEDGQLQPVPRAAGSCQCDTLAAHASPPPPVATPKPEALSAIGAATQAPQPPPSKPALLPASKPALPKSVEYSMPASAAEVHKDETDPLANLPAREEPIWKVMMPPLTFDAASRRLPASPRPEMILLVREVSVEPAWIFHGRVEAGPGQPASNPHDAKPSKQKAQRENAKKNQPGGIRGFFRRLFGGGSTTKA
jgi:hypothetical protein